MMLCLTLHQETNKPSFNDRVLLYEQASSPTFD